MALKQSVGDAPSSVTAAEWTSAVDELVAASRAARAPHRLVLLLFLVSRAHRNQGARVSFAEVEASISPALQITARAAKPEPMLPFWHLQSSPFWRVENADALPRRKGKDRPTRRGLLEADVYGLVPAEWWTILLDSSELRATLMSTLLEAISDSQSIRDQVARILNVSQPGVDQ